MKKRINIFIVILLLINAVSCQQDKGNIIKNNINEIKTVVTPVYPITLEFKYNNVHDLFCGSSYEETFKWYEFHECLDGNIEQSFIGNIMFGLESLPVFVVLDKTDHSIVFKVLDEENRIYSFNDIVVSEHTISSVLHCAQSNIFIDFLFTDETNVGFDFINQYEIGQVAYSSNGAIPPIFIYGAALLIAGTVDLLCARKVKNQVANCTSQGQCSEVLPCGATCITCPQPGNTGNTGTGN